MLLLLPVAWLLDRRQRWAALVPLSLALPVVAITPAAAYPICFVVMLLAPLLLVREPASRGSSTVEAAIT
jgi:hypothetical protein